MSAHNGKTVRCYHDSTDEVDTDVDAEPTTLTFEDHGRFVSTLAGTDDRGTRLRDRFQMSQLIFECPDCPRTHHRCPICTEPDDSQDNTATGYFRGEDTGDALPCNNCNQEEIARRRKQHGHAGKRGSRRGR